MRISARLPLFLLFVVTPAFAKTYTAASCKQSDVNAALNASKKDDKSTVPVVIVPEGNCASTTVSLPRTIVFQGAGKDKTILGPLNGGDTGSRVTGFTFTTSENTTTALITFEGQNWRVDHVKCVNTSGTTFSNCVWAYGAKVGKHPTGLVDHVEMINARVLVYGDGKNEWSSPSTIGKADQTGVVTVEDCTFDFTVYGNAMDAELNARYVFRHNTVRNTQIEAHSNQGTTNSRSWEIYNNKFFSNRGWFAPMFIRGGTGVVFNNEITGDYNFTITMDNVRSVQDVGGPDGKCNGASKRDGNQPGKAGWPCRDQIGRGQNQTSEPAHFWNNTFNGSPTAPRVGNLAATVKPNGAGADILEGRDYLNTPRPGYTPSPYPHPLQGAK